jgi:plastocyanin
MSSSIVLRASPTRFHKSEYEEAKPNKPALAVLSLAVTIIALSLTAFLIVPALGVPEVQQTATGSAGSTVYIIAPAGSGSSLANFSPANFTLVIGVNNTFVLKNEDLADHTMTSIHGDPAAFDTGDISGLTSSDPITLTIPGTYMYVCQFHPEYMRGTITVIASTP